MLNSLLLSAAMIGAGMQPLPMKETGRDMSASVGEAYEKAGVQSDWDKYPDTGFDWDGVTIKVIGHEVQNTKDEYVVQYEQVYIGDNEPVLIRFEWNPITYRQSGRIIK